MGNKKVTKVISLLLALWLLVTGGAIAVSADVDGSVTDKSIADYQDILNTDSYESYKDENFAGVSPATATYSFDATTNIVFRSNDGEIVEIRNGKWTLTDAKGNVYTEAEVRRSNSGRDINDYVHVEYYEGRMALYTPNNGSTTWSLDLAASGISGKALYHISVEYYPIKNKTASIEREFYINGSAPFNEARAITLPKRWSSYKSDGSALTSVFTPDKKLVKSAGSHEAALAQVHAEAVDAGLVAYYSEDGSALLIEQPMVITQKINQFVDKYEVRFFVTDIMNNELRPTMVQDPEWMEYTFRDSDGFYPNGLGFVLEPNEDGLIEFTLKGVNEPVAIAAFVLSPYEEPASYAQYIANLKAQLGENIPEGTSAVKIETEYTVNTSTNVVYPIEDKSDALTSPTDTSRTILNTIGTEKWQTAGQWVQYKFSVDAAGMYEIFARFKQSYLDGMYVGRMLQIYSADATGNVYETAEEYAAVYGNTAGYYNGTPFEEATRLRYDYGNNWQVKGLSTGNADADTMQIYFEAGVVYTIRLEVTLGSMSQLISDIEEILEHLNQDYLDIIKLTGSSPDAYRDYNFYRLLPNTMIDLVIQSRALATVSETLKGDAVGAASSYTGICDKLSSLLSDMGKSEDAIAKNLSNFKSYVGSLGTFLTDAKTQPLQLDFLMVQGQSAKAPQAKAGFFKALWHELSNFFMSFIRDYNSMGAMEESDTLNAGNSVNVWLAYGRDQSQVIRNLCTNDFTPDSHISVDLKLITGGTLLPSILAGVGPDVYLGLGQSDVINYAIRGALMNIEGMEGYAEIEENFNDAAMIVLKAVDADGVEHTYGLPETQSFPMMFVRTDILTNLDIEIPKTWEEIYVAQSVLESNNMEIGVSTEYQIFLYQMRGELFADNGMRINLDSEIGLKAFETMCNMFTQYSFPYKYEAANRSRPGEMPIVISCYTGLYNQLKVFATEIDGCWTFVPLPGYGSPENNQSISAVSAAVMIKKDDSDYKNAWEFMKWYTDAPCQSSYATEMVAILGDSAKHSTANKEALLSMPWTYEEYVEVAKQFNNLASVPNYPGYYIIGRYTNFAFLSAYNDDADPKSELLSYINIINKEITRKREEFKLETLEIGQTLASKRADQALAAIEILKEKFIKQGDTRFDAAILAANYAIANDRIAQLRETSASFMQILESQWNGAMKEIELVDGSKKTVQSYYINVGKQTAEPKFGGYEISSLNEQELIYFISVCLNDIASALESY